MTLRPAAAEDRAFLAEMLREAVTWDPARAAGLTVAEVLATPELAHYVDGWPGPHDFGVIADDDAGLPVAAAWCRRFDGNDPGYGYVADDVPEVSVAVTTDARGRGIGTRLLDALALEARRRRIERLSLSVEKANPAVRLYRRSGYRTVAEDGSTVTMVLELEPDLR